MDISYQEQIERWAAEFEEQRHILTQEEIDALNSDVYTEFLENSEDYD